MHTLILQNSNKQKGFALLGTLITISLFAAFIAGMVSLVATNQQMRVQQYREFQLFACAQASFDFGRGYKKNVSNSFPQTRHLAGCTLLIERVGVDFEMTITNYGVTQRYRVKVNPPVL